MKRMQAIAAAALITALVALGVVAIGVSAAANPNSVPASDSPATAASVNSSLPADQQISELKALVAQYQARDQQFQQQIAAQNSRVQQLSSIVSQLQRAGIISIQSDGTVTLGRRGSFSNDDDSSSARRSGSGEFH